MLVAFDREEQGLYGSAAYVNDHVQDRIQGMINLDAIAWQANEPEHPDFVGAKVGPPFVAAIGTGASGVAIGGDRSTGYVHAKEQLLRPLETSNPVPELAELEARLLHDCSELGIGPMGFGGKTTVLGVKIGAYHRLPACYFVSIAYMCWACRNWTMTVRNGEVEYC